MKQEEFIKKVHEKYEQLTPDQQDDFFTSDISFSTSHRKVAISVFTIIACVILVGTSFTYITAKRASRVEIQDHSQKNLSDIHSNYIWTPTLKLVWQELKQKLGHDIELLNPNLSNEDLELIADLNKEEIFGQSLVLADRVAEGERKLDISSLFGEDNYYYVCGKADLSLKEKIEKEIKQKFGTTSDLIEQINWNTSPEQQRYLLYNMLYKNFTFPVPFDMLEEDYFASSEEKISYFGIDSNSDDMLKENVKVLFYHDVQDFAVILKTTEEDEVILYRTNDTNSSFEELYHRLEQQKQQNVDFTSQDTLKVPVLNINKFVEYEQLEGPIKGEKIIIEQVLQQVKFRLDHTGGTLQSEASMELNKAEVITPQAPRYFDFTNSFVLFLKEKEKQIPYFALKINDITCMEGR